MLELNLDNSIPIPEKKVRPSVVERVEAACATADDLGLDDDSPPDTAAITELMENVAEGSPASMQAASTIAKQFTPATYRTVKGILQEYSVRAVDNAMQIRLLVTNKLLIESENPDPRVRLRALELLGKITDVGLFTEKSEVTITHRSTDDLVASIKAKIQSMREPRDITPPGGAVVDGEAIDVSAELGLD